MTIIVLGGGISSEREVSLRSAAAVSQALRQTGFTVVDIDPRLNPKFLDSVDKEAVVFPILHGAGGEDGTLQTELERRHIPYLGSDSVASRLCFDKWRTRQILQEAGLPVARGEKVTESTYGSCSLIHQPHVVKITQGGSSIGTLIVSDPEAGDKVKLDELFSMSHEAVVEEFVVGTEITVPILDVTALPVVEVQPPPGEEFNFTNKYNGKTQELCPPVSVDEKIQLKVQQLAARVHEVTGARHLSRTDMIIRPGGEVVILEINTMPGMTDQSIYPRSAAAANLPMKELVKKFVELVKRDYNL